MSHSSNKNKRNTATNSGSGGSVPPRAAFSGLKPDEIQVLLLYRRAKALKERQSDIKSLSIDLKVDPILVVTKSNGTSIAADEYIRQLDNDDPIVISNLRLSQVVSRAKARLKKDISSLDELSPKERATVCKSNRSFLEEEKEKKGKESSSTS